MRRIALLLLFAAACGKTEAPADGHEEHAHEPKHGGALAAVSGHELFVEAKHDEEGGVLSVWIYAGEELEEATPDEPPVLNLGGAGGPRQVTGELSNGAWTFRVEGEPEGARLRLRVGGKSYTPDLPHAH